MFRRFLFAIIATLPLVACDNSVYYSDHCDINELSWGTDNPAVFEVSVDDTLSSFDFYIDLRICTDYAYSNAYLFLSTKFPDGGYCLDTLECPLADYDGRWLGKPSRRYVDGRYVLKQNVVFPNCGTYKFTILHGMRDAELKGIRDVGLYIRRHEDLSE